VGRPRRQEAHHREEGDALARAGFADHAERAAALDRERDGVDRVRGAAAIAVEDDLEVIDLEERRGHVTGQRAQRLGSPPPASEASGGGGGGGGGGPGAGGAEGPPPPPPPLPAPPGPPPPPNPPCPRCASKKKDGRQNRPPAGG